MDRRELLTGMAAMVAAATAGRAFAAGEHEHMDHGGMQHEHPPSRRNEKLIAAAADCVSRAQVCLQHCLTLLGKGDTSLADCAKSASEVEAICAALQGMAAAESKSLPALSKVAMEVCKRCEEECRKTDKHPECKACGEACAACYRECQAIAA